MKSFRRRVIFWTSVIAGAVMLAFALGSLFAYDRLKLVQIDSMLESVATRPVPPPFHQPHWVMAQREFSERVRTQFGAEGVLGVYGSEFEGTNNGERTASLEQVLGPREQWPAVKGTLPTEAAVIERPRPGSGRLRMGRGGGPAMAAVSFELFEQENQENASKWRVGLAKHQGFNVVFAIRRERGSGETAAFRNAVLIVFPASLLVLSACIWFYVTRAIYPLNRLGSEMETLSASGLAKPVEVDGEYQEFEVLIERFDSLRKRLNKSFEQATRFSADAAHELKTPLTVIQGQIESELRSSPTGSREQVALAGILDEVFRLKSITRKLLLLAQADAGKLETRLEECNLAKIAEDAVSVVLDTSSNLEVSTENEGEVTVECDVSLTQQILINLFNNACKYRWPLESEVQVRIRREGTIGLFEIENRCQPIEAKTREAIFDRFTRMDVSRNRRLEGIGLGLSLASEFAKAQGGNLELLEFTQPDRIGFRLSLPLGSGLS